MRGGVLALVAAATVATAAPARADDEPVPMRYPPSSVRPGLIAGGLAVTGGAYALTYLSASAWPDVPGASSMKIPVVGPWIALGQSGCAADDPGCGFTLYLRGFLLVIDGLAQAGGLGIAGEGVFMTTEATRPTTQAFSIRPAPIVTDHTTGLAFTGAF